MKNVLGGNYFVHPSSLARLQDLRVLSGTFLEEGCLSFFASNTDSNGSPNAGLLWKSHCFFVFFLFGWAAPSSRMSSRRPSIEGLPFLGVGQCLDQRCFYDIDEIDGIPDSKKCQMTLLLSATLLHRQHRMHICVSCARIAVALIFECHASFRPSTSCVA